MEVRLAFKKFQLRLIAKEQLILPVYKGSTFRGGFGNAFKRIVCTLKNKECPDCILKEKCVYSYVFETSPHSDTAIMRKYEKIPHPFIIEPPDDKRQSYNSGDEIRFNLILIGRAIDYLPYFIYTFEELGKIGIGKGRGGFELQDVSCDGEVIYDSKSKTLKTVKGEKLLDISVDTMEEDMASQTSPCSNLSLSFLTPARIKYNSHLILDLEFHILIRHLLRRIAILSYFHCGIDTSGWDFKGIIEMAKKAKVKESRLKWDDWERYSARQDARMKMGGFVGEITFEGNIAPFMPLIKAGEILHIGKGTSFGLGKYEIQD